MIAHTGAFTAALAVVAVAGCGQSGTGSTASSPSTQSVATSSTSTARSRSNPAYIAKRHSSPPGQEGAGALSYSTASANTVQPQPAPGSCHAVGTGLYSRPDPRCTPGALNPAVTQATIAQTICMPGWTDTVRPPESVTEPEKQASMAAYGDQGPASDYEYDHFVPLELGGAVNDPRNLWPEPGASPNPKDAIEDELNQQVCDGQTTLAQAQRAIVANWTSLATHAPAPTTPSSATGTASASGNAQCTASASYNSTYDDYDVYVHSNQPDQTVTVADAAGQSDSWHTDGSGYADVYFHAGQAAAGGTVTVHVGRASCSAAL